MINHLSLRIGNIYAYDGDAVIIDQISRTFVKCFNASKNQFINKKIPVDQLQGALLTDDMHKTITENYFIPLNVEITATGPGEIQEYILKVDGEFVRTISFAHQLQNVLDALFLEE